MDKQAGELERYPEERFTERYADEIHRHDYFKKVDYHRRYNLISVWMLFFAFSMLGWLWEGAYHWFSRGELVNRGILHGPWVPIYGTAVVLVVVILWRLVDNPVVVFFSIIGLAGVIEYATSVIFEHIQGIRYWDYTQDFMNLNGRIYLEGLLFFGISGCLALYLGVPVMDEMLGRIPLRIRKVLLALLTIIFLVDVYYSLGHPNLANGVVYTR